MTKKKTSKRREFSLTDIPVRKLRGDAHVKAVHSATRLKDQELIYTLADGPLFGLGYKFGLTVFMENMRVNGSFMEAAEFRHGPAEMLDRHKPAFVVLKGNDESRAMIDRILALLNAKDLPLI